MRKIGLLSDTHGSLPEKVFEFFEPCHEIWHAGDVGNESVLDQLEAFRPLTGVFGNIDGKEVRIRIPEYQTKIVEGVKISMIHIGGYPGRYTPKAREIISRENPDIFISGHSHILKVMFDKKHKHLHMNPGAAGKHGLHQKITMLRFDVENGQAKNLEVFEKDRR